MVKKAIKKFVYVFNSQYTIRDSIRALKRYDNEITHDPREMAVIINTNFQEVFVREGDFQCHFLN